MGLDMLTARLSAKCLSVEIDTYLYRPLVGNVLVQVVPLVLLVHLNSSLVLIVVQMILCSVGR